LRDPTVPRQSGTRVALASGMIKVTRFVPEGSSTARLHVDGRIVGKTIDQLEGACAAALATDEPLVLDLAGVAFVDGDGARAIQVLIRDGVVVVGCSPLVDEILRACAVRPDDPATDGDETRLVAALRNGDETAFAEVVRLYGGRMLAVARRMLRVEEDARDAVQEAFVSAFKAVARFQGNARLSTWLHRIVVNAALMRLRRQRRKPEESIDELLPRFDESGSWEREPAHWSTPLDLAERSETRAVVRECIDRLPASYRTVLVLRDLEELDTVEAAVALDISVSAVKTRLHRARQALRALLEQRLGLGSAPHAAAVFAV
jgi:RNA polymerase sigma-70 factor (ECF subfamily)